MSDPALSSLPHLLQGTVVAVQANFYWVTFDSLDSDNVVEAVLPAEALLCTRRTRLKKIGQQVIVGDRVQVEPDWIGGRGVISQVLSRQSELDRPPIANVDQILLLFALAEPTLDPMQLSRFLVKAESTGLAVRLSLNKSDLVSSEIKQQWHDRLQLWGYQPLFISLHQQQGLSQLQTALNHQTTVVAGPSGVGKSSLVNGLIPKMQLRTGAVSGKLGRGRHTTRHVELFGLPTGGLLADTPGFNQPDLSCPPAQLTDCFPEAQQRLAVASCQFSNCLHREEPNCAVRGDWERYEHYLIFLEEVLAHQQTIDRLSDAEATTKAKSGEAGQIIAEPKLAAKKYRRPSRRTEKQSLRQLYRDVDPSEEPADPD